MRVSTFEITWSRPRLERVSRCPRCSETLAISWDMWGPFYACEECGFTAEDDDDLKVGPRRELVAAV